MFNNLPLMQDLVEGAVKSHGLNPAYPNDLEAFVRTINRKLELDLEIGTINRALTGGYISNDEVVDLAFVIPPKDGAIRWRIDELLEIRDRSFG